MSQFFFKSKDDILRETHSSEKGLDSAEAKIRLERNGVNVISSDKKQSLFLKFLSQFKDVFVIILLVASFVSLFFALHNGSSSELVDSIIIFGIVLVNAFLGFSQEIKAENALDNLKKMSSPDCLVIRDGREIRIKTAELVVGDIVILEAGDIVPADIYLLEATALKCVESALTGESTASEKEANCVLNKNTPLGERKNMCFSSTSVAYGHGRGVVVAVGKNAEIGRIASLLEKGEKDLTPLQKSLNKLGEIITFAVLGIAIVIFLVDVIFAHHSYIDSFLTAVAIAVAAIPESLPAVVTIILSIGVTRLARKNAIIKKLHAVETLGCCQVICSDKTGTITQNKMKVRKVYLDGEFRDLHLDNGIDLSQIDSSAEVALIGCMNGCHNVRGDKGGYIGDPTEIALTSFLDENNINIFTKRVGEAPFDSSRKIMSTMNIVGEKVVQFTKGAPDVLLSKCDKILLNGHIIPLDKDNLLSAIHANESMGKESLRALAFAIKLCDTTKICEEDMVFVGMVGMMDPPKIEVKPAIEKCKKAGMRVIMITGDYRGTASAVAKELGIIKSDKEVMEGREIDALTDKELSKRVSHVSVFARVSPEHKVRIVDAIKSSGKIVAMTGDGVNDAPSVKSASIGIGMGKSGTEVTRSVSDLVLADDNFATIVVAVEEGRRIFNNISKTIQFLLSCNIAEVLSIFLITMLFPTHSLFSAVQILFINLVTDTLPSIALGVDGSTRSVMSVPPRDPKRNILHGRVIFDVVYQGVWQTICAVGVYLVGLFGFHNSSTALCMAFVTINMIQLFHMYNVRSSESIFRDKIFSNKLINLAFIAEIIFLILITSVPALYHLVGLVPLGVKEWFVITLASFSIIPFCELVKLFQNHRN